MLRNFLSPEDAQRALATLVKLARHDVSRWTLTGGFAVEIHCLRGGSAPSLRPLNDIDFMADGFDCVPGTLAGDFLFRHIHPLDPPGKTMLQFVDTEPAVLIDLFRARGAIIGRDVSVDLPSGRIQLVSLEDLVARTARLVLDLADAVPVPPKHAHDYRRLVELVNPSQVEAAWQDHRKPKHPATFQEANAVLRNLIPSRLDLLITPHYSKDIGEICPRCTPAPPFQLADASTVLSLLGYC